MSSEISLVFLGGIADSGKSALMSTLQQLDGVEAIRISDCFKKPLGVPEDKDQDKPLRAGVIYRDWKFEAEEKAIKELTEKIEKLRGEKRLKTLVINSHFATYSPGGYMIGLDPVSLYRICEDCLIHKEASQGKAAVVLADIGLGDVLLRREQQWKKNEQWGKDEDVFPTGPGLVQDLEFNRLYALQYYSVLCSILNPERVFYYRAFVDYKQTKDLTIDLSLIAEFREASNRLIQFLKDKKIIPQ